MNAVPLHAHSPADPSWRGAVVSGLYFHTAVQMNRSFPVLVVAEWLNRKPLQRRLFFGKHGCDLTLGGAMNPRVRPAFFSLIEVRLRFGQVLKTLTFERCLLSVANARLNLSFSIRIPNAARHGDANCSARVDRGTAD